MPDEQYEGFNLRQVSAPKTFTTKKCIACKLNAPKNILTKEHIDIEIKQSCALQ